MKKILTLLFFLIATASIGQYPINQILSSDSTMVSVGRNATGGIRGGLVNMVFTDTTAANLSRISYYTGAQIWTTTDSAIWVRFKGTPSFWVKMAGASGGTTGSFWNITGNYFGGGVPLNYGVGTNSYDYLPFKTNNITRLLIPPDGILRSSAPANKYLMMDTTTLEMYYGDGGGGGGGSGWLLTGNSGTTSSNFIGTTDNQPLSFRVNNNWAGRIYTDGSVFIGDSSGVNNSALNNAGFGRYSLYNNTTGEGNTGSGAYSLYSNTTGWNNTGSGVYSLYGNTTGGDNTGSGAYSLNSNIDGEWNTGSGAYSLYSNTTGWNNTGSGVYSLYGNTTGWSNTGSGVYSLRNNTTGSNNTGMGYAAGYNAKQKVDAQNQILIGAGTYGTRDSMTVIGASFMKETIVRGKLIDSTLSAGVGTKAVRWNDATGEFTYADTTAGGGGGGWSLTGNAGTNPASNFIGTTDGQPLMFRYNNQNAGSIGKEGMHTYLGIEAGENDVSGGDPNIGIGSYVLSSNTTGDGNSAVGGFVLGSNTTGYYNSAVGASALSSNTTGYYNSAVGVSALYSNTTGYYNSAVGASALSSNTTGYYNSAVGASAGWNIKQKPDAKYQNLFGANTYGTRDSITVIGANFIKETIVRGKLIDSTLSADAGTKAVRWNSSTGEFTYADTTVGGGGGSPAGSNRQVQYNNSGAFGGATGVEIGNTNNRLLIQSQSTTELPLILKMAASQTAKIMSFQNSSGTELSYVDKDGNAYFNGIKMGKYGGEKGFEITTTNDMYFVTGGDELSFEPGGGTTKMRITYYPTYSQRTLVYGGNTLYEKYGTNLSFYPSSGNSGFGAGGTENLLYITTTGNVGIGTTSPTTKLNVSGTFAANQGSDVASANNLAVVANSTEITGTTQVNLIANTGWVNGSQITLLLASGITIKNGQTTSGSNITILLDGAADFVTSAASSLTLLLCEVGGTQAWREISRRSY